MSPSLKPLTELLPPERLLVRPEQLAAYESDGLTAFRQHEAEEAAEARRREETAKRRAAQPQINLEREWKMYHVAGCPALAPSMERVAIEQKPMGYTPHICIPDDIRNWKRKR